MLHMLILSKVVVVDTLVPASELGPEVAVEDCLDERDIALNCLKLNHHYGPRSERRATYRVLVGLCCTCGQRALARRVLEMGHRLFRGNGTRTVICEMGHRTCTACAT